MYSESLVDLCLETIVDHFPRYNLIFNTTKDDCMKRRFEFLQRKYSFEILTRLSSKKTSLDDYAEYVDLLINKYLKVLDTSWLINCTWEKATSKIAEIGPNVENLFIGLGRSSKMSETTFCELARWQDVICFLPNLKSFTCEIVCHDFILKNVAKFCPNIQEINIKNSTVTGEGVKLLCKAENGEALCTKLKKLYILGSSFITDKGVEYLLKNLPSLEILDYLNLPAVLYTLHRNDLPCLARVKPYNIVKLNIAPFCILYKDILKLCVFACPHLKYLSCSLKEEDDINFISNLSELEELTLENITNSKVNIDELLKSVGGKLFYLSIKCCIISVSVIAGSCPRVKKLNLNSVHFLLDNDSKPFFNSLSSLTFENCNVSECVKAITLLLSSSTKLESLSFEACNLLSSEIKTLILKTCEQNLMKRISFYGSVIDKDYVKDILFHCRTLKYLNIIGFFDVNEENELLKFSETLPNKPRIDIGESMEIMDSEILVGEVIYENSELEDDDFDDNDYDDDYTDSHVYDL